MIKTRQNLQGIAIISVLVVVALISASVSIMYQRFNIDLKQTQYTLSQAQSLNHLFSMEAWAKTILLDDNEVSDNLNELWATSIAPIKIPGGSVFGRLVDLQSKLNLNNIIDLESDIYTPQYRSFFYDCMNRINTQLQQQAMGDTLFAYISQKYPNPKSFDQISEIKNIQSINTNDYLKIKPFITALQDLTPINVNTASLEVLSCIHPQLSSSLAKKIIKKREQQAFSSIDDFWSYLNLLFPHMTPEEIKENMPSKYINTSSNYFLLKTEIIIGENKLIGSTILHRKDGKMNLKSRSYSHSL